MMAGPSGRERRKHPRIEAAFALRLAIEVGVSGSTAAVGTTVNISRGGVLATVDQLLPLRARCSISFVGTGSRVQPTEMKGTVVRVTRRTSGCVVGIAFDQPLDTLEVERTLWKKPRIFGDRHRR